MSALEADAAERAERRRRGRERATQLKDEGNVLFRTGSFQAAFDKYTEVRTRIHTSTVRVYEVVIIE